MNKPGIKSLLTVVSMAIALSAVSACGEQAAPDIVSPTATTGGAAAKSLPTVAVSRDSSTPVPPTVTSVVGSNRDSQGLLDDYIAAVCGQLEVGVWNEDGSLEDLSYGIEYYLEQMGALNPPPEVAEWHEAQLVFAESLKKAIDGYLEDPKGLSENDFLISVFLTVGEDFETVEQAIIGMNPDVRARMTASGCIEEESVSVTPPQFVQPPSPAVRDIHVGDSVSGSLDEPEEVDRFQFEAEAGVYYLIEVNWQSVPRLRLRLFQPPGYNWSWDSEISPISEKWTPDVSGTIQMSISAWNATGAYALSISQDPSPQTPTGLVVSWEGSGIQLSWGLVAGAEYYNVYFDDFWSDRCSIDQHGNPDRCETLVENVEGTSYLHEFGGSEETFYWVAACNSEGCSQVESKNPAVLATDQPGGPKSGGPCRRGIDLDPGDSCTVNATGAQADAVLFAVSDDEACYGDLCAVDSIVQSEFIAYPNFDGSWFINRLPDAHPGGPNPAATN